MPTVVDSIINAANAVTNTAKGLTFEKRKDPHGATLRSNNVYYKSPKNTCLYNTASGGNCVWYAYGRFLEVWSKAPESYRNANPWKGAFQNNGYGMVSSAGSMGFKTGLTPKPGAIISWGYYGKSAGSPGHVAFVEDVKLDSNGKVVSIEVSQSGWSCGDMKNQILYPGTGQKGTGAYKLGYNNSYFNGFAYNPIEFAGSDGYVQGDGSSDEDEPTTEGGGIDFQKRASKLSSSDNFAFITKEASAKPESALTLLGKSLAETFKNSFNTMSALTSTATGYKALSESLLTVHPASMTFTPKINKLRREMYIADNVVEAPFVELLIKGHKIGTYKGALDMYPNYISSLTVSKQNGVINQYSIKLIHQIRPSDDGNLLDELLSINNYDKIRIKYGDCNSGKYFQDTSAIITNVQMNRDYSSNCISYTIEATSAGQLVKTYTMNFGATTDKPSNVIQNLFYKNKETSNILLEAFPGMRNKEYVYSHNLIPTNDSVVSLKSQTNVNLIDYLNYLVACMSNNHSGDSVIRNSTYYVSYVDNVELGSFIKVNELVAGLNPYGVTDKIYNITIGYNKDIVYNFTVDETSSWELLYENSTKMREYYYTINNNGDVSKYYSPSIASSTSLMNEMNKNWWTQMIKFPLTAKLTLKGLLAPVMLMDYININVVFFGQKHISSGVYAITGQTDSLGGDGYKTTLDLVRVSDNV